MGYHSYIDTCATELVQVIGQFVPLESGRTLPAGQLCRDLEMRCSDISKISCSPLVTVLGVAFKLYRGSLSDFAGSTTADGLLMKTG